MPPSSATVRSVFWPKGCRKTGICYGWTKPAICIAGVLDVANVQDAADAMKTALSASPLWNPLAKACGGDPTPLGICQFDSDGRSEIPASLNFWNFSDKKLTYSIILYIPHAPYSLRFYVLEHPSPLVQSSTPLPPNDPYDRLAQHDFTRRRPANLDQALNEVIINQLNASSILESSLKPSSSSHPKLLPTTASLLLTLAAHSALLAPILLVICRFVAAFANLPLVPFRQSSSSFTRLKDISTTVQQLDVRVEQTVFFVTQVSTLQRQNTCGVTAYSARYTNFFNTVWLIMNDVTLGLGFGTFLSENSAILADLSNACFQKYLFHLPRAVLYWLDAWPAGLKLNTQLSRFYAATLIGVIDTWNAILPPISPSFINVLGILSSVGGLTLLLSLLSDLLSMLLTAHLRLGYELTRAIYWAAGVKLGGGLLWGVFRGKRRNVLRNRTDSWSYDIDQLLFGTVLFTLLAFLFPTALVYYVLFAGLRLATLLVQACIETLLAFMHHFPLFALMLRVKDPWRLPGGVCFSVKFPPNHMSENVKPSEDGPNTTSVSPVYLLLENQPIFLSDIFFQYNELWSRLARHYNPLRLLYQVLSGQHLASIPRYSIRYALPEIHTKKKME